MFLRQYFRKEHGRRVAYWALVESYRTVRDPRQRVVSWLGLLDEAGRLGVQQAAQAHPELPSAEKQRPLFEYADAPTQPCRVEVDTTAVRVENDRQLGEPWLALQLIERLGLDEFLAQHLPPGREQVRWSLTAMILVIARLLEPSSELHIAELPSATRVLAEQPADLAFHNHRIAILLFTASAHRLETLFNLLLGATHNGCVLSLRALEDAGAVLPTSRSR